ncbi:MAG: branched-chain amino acid ABC transporter substrate-binding protein [Proteobacteria bacterium]|nr:branched-chain amino acid ABC transporter substrate-binding protein [Pseudomonadota bacterium]
MTNKIRSKMILAAGAILLAGSALAQVKIAYIDPLSGMMGATGEHGLREFQFAVDQLNARGGVLGKKFEMVPLDNKLSPQESMVLLNRAIDQGVRYITQGNGSSVAGALIEAVNKHNARNPDKTVLFLNYAAVDPDFTNSKCSFWHFRFDANSDMKLEALTNVMEGDKKIKKVYIFGQDYSFGHQVSKTAKEMIAKKRPDIKIVGDELHPLARIKDFSPYIAKIKASGADSIITGNWGSDLALLIKAAKDAGLKANFYTFYAGVVGSPMALGDAGIDRVKVVSYHSESGLTAKGLKYVMDYKKKYGQAEDPYTQAATNAVGMIAAAMEQVKSDDPVKVAKALEGMHYDSITGDVQMRASDHQLIQPLFVETFAKVDGKKVKLNADGVLEYGFRNDKRVEGYATALPTSCIMEKP